MREPSELPTQAEILAARPAKNRVNPLVPWAFHVEPERSAAGRVAQVATVFLTNRECPFRCLMCDLWKNTSDEPVPPGAIPAQIDYALARLPAATQIKLYNSGNFFDPLAIPREDYPAIAQRVGRFENVIVENHPRLCSEVCADFRDLTETQLEVALGLETIHPEVLPALNKRMTVDDFDRAAAFLQRNNIAVRAFILLKPPLLDEQAGIDWALRSIDHALAVGAGCCSVIPTRAGNGIMESLAREGRFAPPQLSSLETVLEEGIRLARGRVFVDLWDTERLCACARCGPARLDRLRRMNLLQEILPRIVCDCELRT